MPDWFMMLLPKLTIALFIFAFGACVGSLVNVLVYRLPLGLDVVRPCSRCPKCDHKLSWRENIPIFGWLLLRGKCRFCRAPISAEYPIVEFIVAALFAVVYVLWYVVPVDAVWLGVHWGSIAPEWAHNGVGRTWPALVVMLVLVGSLAAVTIVDAKTYTIPLVLTWVPAAVALVFHVGHAVWFERKFGAISEVAPGLWRGAGVRWLSAPGEVWTLATPGVQGWRWIGIALGGMSGLVVSLVLLKFGLIRRSFADYEEWEKEELEKMKREGDGVEEAVGTPSASLCSAPPPHAGEGVGVGVGEGTGEGTGEDPLRHALHDTSPVGTGEEGGVGSESRPTQDDPQMWIRYPHARREMVKELAFLAPVGGLGMVGGWLAVRLGGAGVFDPGSGAMVYAHQAPLWLVVLAGVLLGYLIGGGLVWMVRIFGSLAFGKEAMGLGDVHLMACAGACLGWIDPVIAFFLAAFIGVFWEIVRRVIGGKFSKALPYGPHLAVATMVVVLCKPLVEAGLGVILKQVVNLP